MHGIVHVIMVYVCVSERERKRERDRERERDIPAQRLVPKLYAPDWVVVAFEADQSSECL